MRELRVGDRVERVSSGTIYRDNVGKVFSITKANNYEEYYLSEEGWWSKHYVKKHFRLLPNKNLIGGKLL